MKCVLKCICFHLFEMSECFTNDNNNNNSSDPIGTDFVTHTMTFHLCANEATRWIDDLHVLRSWINCCAEQFISSIYVDINRSNQTNTRRSKKKKPSTSSYVQRVIKIGGLYLVEWTVFEKKNQQQQPSVFSLPLLRHYLFSIFFFQI